MNTGIVSLKMAHFTKAANLLIAKHIELFCFLLSQLFITKISFQANFKCVATLDNGRQWR